MGIPARAPVGDEESSGTATHFRSLLQPIGAQWLAMVVPLPDLLRRHADASTAWVERAIFGTSDPDQMADLVGQVVSDLLGAPVSGGTFYGASAGGVLGLHLTDGRSVVLKAYQPHWERPFLQATQRVQRAVHQSGFPCPAPIAGPVPFGHGLATLESFLPDPGLHRPEGDELLERSSSGLVRLLRAAGGENADGLDLDPFRIAPGDLYPTPHSPIFDFLGTNEGAEWIDEIARAAWVQRERADGPPVIAHMDWSARNVRFNERGICAVYDWDSLSLASEAVVAGQSAATWRSTSSTGDVPSPVAAEIERYLAAFGAARGTPLSASELSAARSAAVWVMAYSARCEHALELRTPYVRHRARHWLRTESSQLL
jgi:hypothetical protein